MKKQVFAIAAAISLITLPNAFAKQRSAYVAGGCFWCIEKDFESVKGVSEVSSGYLGGGLQNPTYKNHSGHREVVKIDYDDAVLSYSELLKIFFQSIDPTDAKGQFCDRGYAYTTVIHVQNAAERAAAEKAKAAASSLLGKQVVTPIENFAPFTRAEEYHQDYYKKNKMRYNFYRGRCGRDDRVKAVWGTNAYYGVGSKYK